MYGPLLLPGAVLLFVPEPLTSMLGTALLLIGGFVAVIDVLSPPCELSAETRDSRPEARDLRPHSPRSYCAAGKRGFGTRN